MAFQSSQLINIKNINISESKDLLCNIRRNFILIVILFEFYFFMLFYFIPARYKIKQGYSKNIQHRSKSAWDSKKSLGQTVALKNTRFENH